MKPGRPSPPGPLAGAFLLCGLDIATILLSFFLALLVQFDFRLGALPRQFWPGFFLRLGLWCGLCLGVFGLCRLYGSLLRFFGAKELLGIGCAYGILLGLGLAGIRFFRLGMPLSFYTMGFVFSFLGTVAVRFSYRLLCFLRRLPRRRGAEGLPRLMIIGAGAAGRALANEFHSSDALSGRVVCVIDDDPAKLHKRLCGIPIVGSRRDIPEAAKRHRVSRILFAIPSCSPADREEILSLCSTTCCQVQVLPGLSQMVNREVSVSTLRQVDVQDLLGREPVRVNLDEIFRFLAGKVVLVTGGGGSIGSELCRQIAKAAPKKLILFEIYENSAYDIQQELKRTAPELDLEVLIGSVRDTARLEAVMDRCRPELVFHAAAHKHVPLMEESPNEAIKNNVLGTCSLARTAAKHRVRRFVLISTDKAVNPTNIMGASKRLCEMVVQMMDRATDTEFVAVRFGNVLGSNGSVVPLFQKQIASGGPVTVTHPEVIRYFMTIPEAVSLVLQAGFYARGGEIFVLDMGQPVKIDDMARKLIRLSGFEPDVDIPIRYTGLRPGEKLFEELLMAEEGLRETENRRIRIGKPIEMDDAVFREQLEALETACRAESPDIKTLVARILPTYHPGGNDASPPVPGS